MTALRAGCCLAALLAGLGCKSSLMSLRAPESTAPAVTAAAPLPPLRPIADTQKPESLDQGSRSISLVSHQEPIPVPDREPMLAAESTLPGVVSREWLQAEIEAHNPSLEAMLAAAQAAAQLYPQRVALDDPVLMGMI